MIVDRPGDGHRAGREIRHRAVQAGGVSEDHAHVVTVDAGALTGGKGDGNDTRGSRGKSGDIGDIQVGCAA